MTDLPEVPKEISSAVLSLLDLFDRSAGSLPEEVREASKTLRAILTPPKTTIREKVVIAVVSGRAKEENSFEIADNIITAISEHIAAMDFVPSCGSDTGEGCFVLEERNSILKELQKEIPS